MREINKASFEIGEWFTTNSLANLSSSLFLNLVQVLSGVKKYRLFWKFTGCWKKAEDSENGMIRGWEDTRQKKAGNTIQDFFMVSYIYEIVINEQSDLELLFANFYWVHTSLKKKNVPRVISFSLEPINFLHTNN